MNIKESEGIGLGYIIINLLYGSYFYTRYMNYINFHNNLRYYFQDFNFFVNILFWTCFLFMIFNLIIPKNMDDEYITSGVFTTLAIIPVIFVIYKMAYYAYSVIPDAQFYTEKLKGLDFGGTPYYQKTNTPDYKKSLLITFSYLSVLGVINISFYVANIRHIFKRLSNVTCINKHDVV